MPANKIRSPLAKAPTNLPPEIQSIEHGVAQSMRRLVTVLDMEPNPYCAALGVDIESSEWRGETPETGKLYVQGFEAPKASVSWCTLTSEVGPYQTAFRLRAFNGAATAVPHLAADISVVGEQLRLRLDFLHPVSTK